METTIEIKERKLVDDYFPCLFVNSGKNVVILADAMTSDKTFSGMVIHAEGGSKKNALGTYSTGWTYEQFKRLPKGSEVSIKIKQENG